MKQMKDFLAKNNIMPLGGLGPKGVDKKESQYRWRIVDPDRFTRFITHIIEHAVTTKSGIREKKVYLIIGI